MSWLQKMRLIVTTYIKQLTGNFINEKKWKELKTPAQWQLHFRQHKETWSQPEDYSVPPPNSVHPSPKRPSPVPTFGVVSEWITRGQCNQSLSQISLCLRTYPSPCSWQETSNLTCVESDSNSHFSGQESATIPEMLLKFSELLHHMDGARQGELIGRDFYAKMDFLNWQGLPRCTYHAYRIRKAF